MKVQEYARRKGLRYMGKTPSWPPPKALVKQRERSKTHGKQNRRTMSNPAEAPAPYFMDLAQKLLLMGEARDNAWQQILMKYKLTLSLLQDIKAGNVKLEQVNVSDDGWEVVPNEPSPSA